MGNTIGPFNSREIATGFWTLVFVIWGLSQPSLRKSFGDVLRAFFTPKIIGVVLAAAVYTSAAVMLLSALGLWTSDLLKDTVFWFCGTGVVLSGRFISARDTDGMFGQLIRDSVAVAVVVEFLVNDAYTFALPVEFLLVPTLASLGMMDAFAASDEQYRGVGSCTRRLLALIGFALLAVVFVRALLDLGSLATTATIRTIILPPLLSVLFSPCLYGLVLISNYEQIFLRLRLGREKNRELVSYAHRRILLWIGVSLSRSQQLLRDHAHDLMQAQTTDDIDRLLDRIG